MASSHDSEIDLSEFKIPLQVKPPQVISPQQDKKVPTLWKGGENTSC